MPTQPPTEAPGAAALWDDPKPTALLVLADGTVLEGVGGLMLEGGKSTRPAAIERTLIVLILRFAPDDQHSFALDVDPRVVVVIELAPLVPGRDPVSCEDDGDSLEFLADADGQRCEVRAEPAVEPLP